MSYVSKEQIGETTLYLGDCFDVLSDSFAIDSVITDPPYSEVTHKGARGKGWSTGGKHVLVDFDSMPSMLLGSIVGLPKRWCVVFADHINSIWLTQHPNFIRLGVWVKNDPAPQFSGDRPATGWEHVVLLHKKGRKRWNGGGRPAVWKTNIEKRGNHPTTKPLRLIEALVSDFTDSGETILDPFMGSGTTGVACANLQRRFIGIEIDSKYFDIACERIDNAYRQGHLFEESA